NDDAFGLRRNRLAVQRGREKKRTEHRDRRETAARGHAAGERVEREENSRSGQVREDRVAEERNGGDVTEDETRGRVRMEPARRPLDEVARQEKEGRGRERERDEAPGGCPAGPSAGERDH